MAAEFTIDIKRYEPKDPRLGRHKAHDSRSLRYRAPAKAPRSLKSVRHQIKIPILDQGQVGACTGFTGCAAIATQHYWAASEPILTKTEPSAFAFRLYSEATKIDPWPGTWEPDDTGSNGLSIAKVLRTMGLVSGYQHATSLEAALTALADRPVMIGSGWRTQMFDPDSKGRVNIGGNVEGGHEYLLDELDVSNQRVWIRNSWSEYWGIKGRAWLTWEDLRTLLMDDGDCVVLVPATAPPPQPTDDVVVSDLDNKLKEALTKFLKSSSCPKYLRTPAEAWLK